MADNADTKIGWLCCPKCGGKTRTQIRPHTVLEGVPSILSEVQIYLRDPFQATEN